MSVQDFLPVSCVDMEQKKGNTMQPVDEATTTEAQATLALKATDRCDICDAQAYIRVELVTGELLFCSHHGNEKKAQLESIAKSWHDESSKLLPS